MLNVASTTMSQTCQLGRQPWEGLDASPRRGCGEAGLIRAASCLTWHSHPGCVFGTCTPMGAPGAMHLLLCLLTVAGSLQAAAAARGARTLLQDGGMATPGPLPTQSLQVGRPSPRPSCGSALCSMTTGGIGSLMQRSTRVSQVSV